MFDLPCSFIFLLHDMLLSGFGLTMIQIIVFNGHTKYLKSKKRFSNGKGKEKISFTCILRKFYFNKNYESPQ